MKKIAVVVITVALGGFLSACGGGTSAAQACENAFQTNYPTASSYAAANPNNLNSFPGEPKSLSTACDSLSSSDQAAVVAWAKQYYQSHP
jgi:nicotinic acid phosphoribosyltransferase